MWKIQFHPSFVKSFRRLDNKQKQPIESFLKQYGNGIEEPLSLQNIKKIEGHIICYRLRFWQYRVGLDLYRKEKIIVFRYVGPRGDFYKNFP
jgi:mRNA-degrading endonuclease RelE of RelBE toxin-antitoxin system